MPTYLFKDKETHETHEAFMKIFELDTYLADNPNLFQVMTSNKLVYEPGTNLKVDDGFREVLSKMKDTYKINNIKSY